MTTTDTAVTAVYNRTLLACYPWAHASNSGHCIVWGPHKSDAHHSLRARGGRDVTIPHRRHRGERPVPASPRRNPPPFVSCTHQGSSSRVFSLLSNRAGGPSVPPCRLSSTRRRCVSPHSERAPHECHHDGRLLACLFCTNDSLTAGGGEGARTARRCNGWRTRC